MECTLVLVLDTGGQRTGQDRGDEDGEADRAVQDQAPPLDAKLPGPCRLYCW